MQTHLAILTTLINKYSIMVWINKSYRYWIVNVTHCPAIPSHKLSDIVVAVAIAWHTPLLKKQRTRRNAITYLQYHPIPKFHILWIGCDWATSAGMMQYGARAVSAQSVHSVNWVISSGNTQTRELELLQHDCTSFAPFLPYETAPTNYLAVSMCERQITTYSIRRLYTNNIL